MAYQSRRTDYFYTTVKHRPGAAYRVLSSLSSEGVSLLAFASVPMGPETSQLTLFPEDVGSLAKAAERAGLSLDGPHPAILVQGDDQLGALADVHSRLYDAGVNVFAANGVTDGKGCYGYVLYVRPEDIERATSALGD